MTKSQRVKKISVISSIVVLLVAVYFFLVAQDNSPTYWSKESSNFVLDKQFGFKHKNNTEYEEVSEDGQDAVQYRFNNMGLRGSDLSPNKKDYRVALVGSSVVFGQGVPETDTMSEQLSGLFKSENKKIEVINAGFVAYSLDQKLKAFEMGLVNQLKADEIVFLISSIDFISLKKSVLVLSLYDYDPQQDTLTTKDISNDFFYKSSVIAQKINDLLGLRQFIGLIHTATNKYNNELDLEKQIPYENKRIIAILKKIKTISQEQRSKIHFLILPNKFHIGCPPYRKLAETFNVVDLNFNKEIQRNWNHLFLEDGYHLSNIGHGRVAKIIKDVLSGIDR